MKSFEARQRRNCAVAALAAAMLIGNADTIGFLPAAILAIGVAMSIRLQNGPIV